MKGQRDVGMEGSLGPGPQQSAGLEQSHHLYKENCPEQAHCQLGTVGPSVLLSGAFLERKKPSLCMAKLLPDVLGEG